MLDLKNNRKLIPHSVHPGHELTDGILLHQCGELVFHDDLGTYFAWACDSCLSILTRDKTPPLVLANNMWIGDILLALKILTLPECILIA